MKITPAQARQAFYQAAANIEARPELYDFGKILVGEADCPACMWGHVGRALGISAKSCIYEAAEAVGFSSGGRALYYFEGEPDFRGFSPTTAAEKLREFADHHWPAESTEPVRPDLVECGLSFSELMDSLGGFGMSETKFTPGPWSRHKHAYCCVVDSNERLVANCGQSTTSVDPDRLHEIQEANTDLISAAPDLYEALIPFARFACDEPCDCHNCVARDVLTKARGES